LRENRGAAADRDLFVGTSRNPLRWEPKSAVDVANELGVRDAAACSAPPSPSAELSAVSAQVLTAFWRALRKPYTRLTSGSPL
jgi:hypothetical protein